LVESRVAGVLAVANNPVGYDEHDALELTLLLESLRRTIEHRRTAEALTASAHRFQLLFEHSLAPIVITNRAGHCVAVNTAACELFGYPREQLLSMSIADLQPPEPGAGLKAFESYFDGPHEQRELRFVRPDGEHRVALWSNSPISADEHASVLRDITEERGLEQHLRAERARAQQYLDIAGAILLALDGTGRVTLANRRACEILGYDEASDIVGKSWIDSFIPKNEREDVRRILDALLAGNTEEFESGEGWVLTRTGGRRLVSWRNAVVRDATGSIVGTLSSGEDITAARELQAHVAQIAFPRWGCWQRASRTRSTTHFRTFSSICRVCLKTSTP
jgi:PAS domain S-box-containing protein